MYRCLCLCVSVCGTVKHIHIINTHPYMIAYYMRKAALVYVVRGWICGLAFECKLSIGYIIIILHPGGAGLPKFCEYSMYGNWRINFSFHIYIYTRWIIYALVSAIWQVHAIAIAIAWNCNSLYSLDGVCAIQRTFMCQFMNAALQILRMVIKNSPHFRVTSIFNYV